MPEDITSAINDFSQTILDIASIYQAHNTSEYNRNMAKWYYEDQKKWNSPAYQMELRRKAGLNPYGTFQTNSVGAPSAIEDSVPESLQAMSDHLSTRQQRKIESAAQRLTYKQILLDEKRVENDTKRAEAQAKLISSQATYQNLINSLKEMLFPNELDLSDAEVTQMLLNNGILAKTFQGFDEMNQAQLDKLVADTRNSNASADLSNKQIERINKLLPAEVKQLSANATQAEFEAAVASAVDMILPDDDPKSKKTNKPLKAIIKLALKKFLGQ